MAAKLTKSDMDFVKSQDVGRVATVDKNGMPHSVPVCPVLDGGKIYFATELNASKVKNIEATSKAAIVFDLYSNSWKKLRGVMLRCNARVVKKAAFTKIRAKLYKKYPQYKKEAPIEPGDSVIVELQPVKKFVWGF